MSVRGVRGVSMALPLLSALIGRVRGDSVARNSAYMMATTVVTSGLGYLYWIVAARLYAPREVGLAAAAIAAMTLASNLSNLGVGATLVGVLPGRASGRAWSLALNAGLAVGVCAGLLAGAAVVALLPAFAPAFGVVRHSAVYAGAFVAGAALWTAVGLVDSAFVAERAAGNMLARNAAFAALKIPLLLAPVLAVGAGSLGIVGSWVLATAASALGGMLLVRRLGRGYRPALRGVASQVPAMLSSLLGNHFINLGGMAPMYLLPVLVTARLSATDNAYFYATWMLGSLFFMVSASVAASLYAEGSRAGRGFGRNVRFGATSIAVLLAPAMAVFLLGDRHILAVFGPAYPRHGQALLALLVVSAVPDAVTNVYVTVLRVRRRLRAAALLNVGMALLALTLAWVLLPAQGIAGAGWAWLAAELAGGLFVGVHLVMARRAERENGGVSRG